MPRGKQTSGNNNTGMPEFVAVDLADEDKVRLQKTIFNDATAMDFLVKCVEQSIKVSIAWDEWNDAAIVTLTKKLSKDDKRGVALSSRGPGVYEALTVSAFKFYERLDGDLANAAKQATKRDWS